MENKTVIVNGMTCNHCKANVENNLSVIEGIKNIEVDLATSKVKISGDAIDLATVKKTVESIGYQYAGEA
jgi:copper chaperone CopZ